LVPLVSQRFAAFVDLLSMNQINSSCT
jgi:hypothetical protein